MLISSTIILYLLYFSSFMSEEYRLHPNRIHWILNTITLLLLYSYIKESLQFPAILIFIFTFISIGIWAYYPIVHSKGNVRLAYILPCLFFVVFAITFSQAVKNEGGYKGGLDDGKWIVKHRACFQWIIYAIFSHFILL